MHYRPGRAEEYCVRLVVRLGMANGLETLLISNLGLKRGESIAFIHDPEFATIVAPMRVLCEQHGIGLGVFPIEYDGIQPLPAEIKDLIQGSAWGVILFGAVHNIWHTPERKHAKYDLNKRLASIVCAPYRVATAGAPAGIPLVAAACRQFSKLFTRGAVVRITAPAGSDFTARIETPFCEHGEYDVPGSGGDFPAGEVGFGPVELSVTGRIVYDVKVQHLGVLESPLVLDVESDRVVEVAGAHRAAFLDLVNRRGSMLEYISEISLGLNPLIGITPESEFIPEEKTYGTAHCGHGGNLSYGRRTGPHIDGVIDSPHVEINGATVVENGHMASGVIESSIVDWLNHPF
jgi:hypothetical protein